MQQQEEKYYEAIMCCFSSCLVVENKATTVSWEQVGDKLQIIPYNCYVDHRLLVELFQSRLW